MGRFSAVLKVKLSRRVVGTSVGKSSKHGTKDGSGVGWKMNAIYFGNLSSFVYFHCFRGIKHPW